MVEIKKKNNNGISIKCNFDSLSYKFFLEKLKILIKRYENNSNVNHLKYTMLINGTRTPFMPVKGWASRILNPKTGEINHIIMLDYDNTLKWIMEEELRFLIDKYDLSPFYVFSTSEYLTKSNNWECGNYLALCMTKKKFKEVIRIHQDTSSDIAHRMVGRINPYKCWVTRLGIKGRKDPPKFKEIVGDLSKKYNQDISEAHLKVIEGLYKNIPKIKYLNKDEGKVENLFFDDYTTASH